MLPLLRLAVSCEVNFEMGGAEAWLVWRVFGYVMLIANVGGQVWWHLVCGRP